jgi:hypothetical protein
MKYRACHPNTYRYLTPIEERSRKRDLTSQLSDVESRHKRNQRCNFRRNNEGERKQERHVQRKS